MLYEVITVRATAEIFSAQLQRYEDLPRTIDALESVVHPKDPSWVDDDGRLVWQGNNVILTFGKHRGTPLQNVIQRDRDYIQWILDGSFPESTKNIIRQMIDGIVPEHSSA